MKKYNINKMIGEWSTGGSIEDQNPFPSPDNPDDVEDLTSGDKESNLTTNILGPTDPKNIPGPDRTKVVKEAEGDVTKTTAPAPTPTPTQEPPMTTPDMKMDPSMSDPSMGAPPGGDMGAQDPSMMGIGMPSGPASTFEVGRIYELKKIYSRLVSMQSYLAGTTDPNLIKLRNYVSSSMDLFRTLISNIALYKDRLDEIIIVFYKVVDNVYVILSKYYKDKDSGKMIQAIESEMIEGIWSGDYDRKGYFRPGLKHELGLKKIKQK